MANGNAVEVNPTIDLHGEVNMGSAASEYNAEAWAVGQRHGVDVPATDQTYHNNAKYYAEYTGEMAREIAEQAVADAAREARTDVLKAEGLAIGKQNGQAVEAGSPYYQANAEYYAGEAGDSAEEAESWAKGTRGGTDVAATDPAYHNNAKYYAEMAQENQNQTARDVMAAQEAAGAARGAVENAEAAQAAAENAAREAAETVVAAQGPGILYIGDDGIPFVIE